MKNAHEWQCHDNKNSFFFILFLSLGLNYPHFFFLDGMVWCDDDGERTHIHISR